MFNAKAISAPKVNAFADAIRKSTKLKVTPAFRSASGPRFEIIANRTGKRRDLLVVDVDRDARTMRITGLTVSGDEVQNCGSRIVKSFKQFERVLSNEFGIELAH